mmetsp:Transcript_75636/g.162189  ORF Transcript_75636/g.162189 Transcript_75636/m.162189 type:complete len:434 (+) Transcript_75636:166-1467(+)
MVSPMGSFFGTRVPSGRTWGSFMNMKSKCVGCCLICPISSCFWDSCDCRLIILDSHFFMSSGSSFDRKSSLRAVPFTARKITFVLLFMLASRACLFENEMSPKTSPSLKRVTKWPHFHISTSPFAIQYTKSRSGRKTSSSSKMVFPSSNFLVVSLELSSCNRSMRAAWKMGLAAKRWASVLSRALPKPTAQPSRRWCPKTLVTLPPAAPNLSPMAVFKATKRWRACSKSRIRASGYLARTGIATCRLSIMQWHWVAAMILAVRLSRRSKTQISPKRSFSSLPRNSPQAVTSTAPRSKTYISSHRVSPSWMMTRPGRYQYDEAFMASSATKSCIVSSLAKKGTLFSASHCTACCSKLMSSLTSINFPSSMSLDLISRWNFLFSHGYFSRMEWKVLRRMMATSHFCKERTDAVRRLWMLKSAASPTMEPSRSLQT